MDAEIVELRAELGAAIAERDKAKAMCAAMVRDLENGAMNHELARVQAERDALRAALRSIAVHAGFFAACLLSAAKDRE
jgi:hypothetical protein